MRLRLSLDVLFEIAAIPHISSSKVGGAMSQLQSFGEMVLFKSPLTGAEKAHKEPWKDRWVDGVYFGTLICTSENLIGTDKGVFKVNALRRRPLDERCCWEEVDKVQGCPHKPVPGSESFRIPTFVGPELQGHGHLEVKPRELVRQQDDPPQVRDLYVSKEEVINHGPSPNCQRCRAVVAGKASTKPHTDECRMRFRELMKSTEAGRRKVKRAEERMVAETYRRSNVMDQDDENEKKRLRESQGSDQAMTTDDNSQQPGLPKQDTTDDTGSHSQTAASSNAAAAGSTSASGEARGSKRSQAPPAEDDDQEANVYRRLNDDPSGDHFPGPSTAVNSNDATSSDQPMSSLPGNENPSNPEADPIQQRWRNHVQQVRGAALVIQNKVFRLSMHSLAPTQRRMRPAVGCNRYRR